MKSLKVASQRILCPLQQNLLNLDFEKQQKQCSEKAEVKQILASECLKNDTEKVAQCESKVDQPSLSKPTETEKLAPIQPPEEVEIKQALPDMSYLQYSDINAEQIMKEIQGKKLKTMLHTIQLPTLNELTKALNAAPQKDGLTPQQQSFRDYTLEAQQKYSGIIKQVESNQKLISEWIKNGATKTAQIQSEIEQAKTEGKNVSPEALQKILDQGQVVKDTVLNFMNILARENSKNLNKAESKDVNVDSIKANENGKFVQLEDKCEKQSLESAATESENESTSIIITKSIENVKFGEHQQPKESDPKLAEELNKAQKQLEYFQKLAADQAEALKNFELAKSLEKQLSTANEKTDKAEKALRKREALDSVSRDLVLKRFKEDDDDEHSPVV
uniref:Uncharacterized protein n=1 Tax=Panagrolaimus sp. ES5 TaxID=591445 RepID=A0AC34GBA2_9BILA